MANIHKMTVNVDGICGYADFIIKNEGDQLLAAGLFERSKVKARSIGCKFGHNSFQIGYHRYSTGKMAYDVDYTRIPLRGGRDFFYYVLACSRELGENYLITTEATLEDDLYDFFMQRYKLPLLKWWVTPLSVLAQDRHLISVSRGWRAYEESQAGTIVCLHGKEICLSDIQVYDFSALDDVRFQELVSQALRERKCWITQREIAPLEFKTFDEYISKYGPSLVENLEKTIDPLCELKGQVDGLALKHKRLYPQQAACVNGVMALRRSGVKYAIMNEGMGTGKTIQGASVVDAYFVEDYLAKHPGKTLKDAYQKDVISYRAIIMAPGHLVEKWKEEIEKEIPFAKGIILKDFSQLVMLREHGKQRDGKEFYILSKDFCKLGSQISPIPTMVRWKYPAASICSDCFSDSGAVRYQKGSGKSAVCPECGGKRFQPYPLMWLGKRNGLICPSCGELLLSIKNPEKAFSTDGDDEDGNSPEYVLTPKDFESPTAMNQSCYHCGAPLWGVNVKNIDCGGEYSKYTKRAPKWSKISYYKNFHKKAKKTSFVLKGHMMELIDACGVREYEPLKQEYGPRKTAPSLFIKKYLKGYFDFCILDEVHKFEGAGTAQANAAHSLIKASDFTLGLTGTISNGSAGSFFYLLFMLDPGRLISKGYHFTQKDYLQFCKDYGSVETVYEYGGNADAVYNANSRGRQLQQPRVMPGISPVLFVDFLLDRCVFLDITDLSKYLPPLYERVVTCDLPKEVGKAYDYTVEEIKESLHTAEGRSAMTSILQFGLSYPDKPYGRKDIMSAYKENYRLAEVKNFQEYAEAEKLLPKEEELVRVIRKEMEEGRNCFVYASYTGEAETNITNRLQAVIETHCNLKGRVQIVTSTSPAPIAREKWIQQKASEGIKVFITNPKCVETGLDFCFKYNGAMYNYPTLIFMQMSYEMSVIWQASRRHYRLNQTKECRTYYLAYEGTLQTAALEIMAAKQVATSAIQGKFSADGLASMAKGVDTRTQLAAALAANDMSDRKSLENMFDALNEQNNSSDDGYDEYVPPKTYYEVVGANEADEEEENLLSAFGVSMIADEYCYDTVFAEKTVEKAVATEPEGSGFFDGMFSDLFDAMDDFSFTYNSNIIEDESKKKSKPKKAAAGQTDLFRLLGIAN